MAGAFIQPERGEGSYHRALKSLSKRYPESEVATKMSVSF